MYPPLAFPNNLARYWLSRLPVVMVLVLLIPGSASAGSTRSVVPGNGTAADKHAGDGLQARQQDQLNLEIVGQLGGVTQAVDVVGGHAYVGIGPRLAVADVSNPTAPRKVGYFETDGAYGVQVAGKHAYIGDDEGLQVIDVSNPAAPRSGAALPSRRATAEPQPGIRTRSGAYAYNALI